MLLLQKNRISIQQLLLIVLGCVSLSLAHADDTQTYPNPSPYLLPYPHRAPVNRANSAAHLQNLQERAAQGDKDAQTALADTYHAGKIVPQDDQEAAHWYRLAAEQNQPMAQYQLGLLYEQGQGVPQDDAQAAKWYWQAAAQGGPEFANTQSQAKNRLGVLYAEGRGDLAQVS